MSDDVRLIVDGKEFSGWTDVRIARGIEMMPSNFTVSATERYPGSQGIVSLKAGQPCVVKIGEDRVITGYIDRVTTSIGLSEHTVTIVGRGMCCDLVDCMAEWDGFQITGASVLEVARKLAAPFGIPVDGVQGPAVGGAGGVLIPQFVLYIGETPWEIIERLCRIAGLLAYDRPDGGLRLAANPADLLASDSFNAGASGFEEGVNIQHWVSTFGMDQRYSVYRTYLFNFDNMRTYGGNTESNQLAEFKDQYVPRYRPRAILAEINKTFGVENAIKRATWEAKRRFGRSHVIRLTTDSWRDASGKLYEPNTSVPVKCSALKVVGNAKWLISEVAYRLGEKGTECDVTLMPPSAFDVAPTLPPFILDPAVARAEVVPR